MRGARSRLTASLYIFQFDTKQVFVENHSVNIVHLNVRKRIGTISYIKPVINKCTQNVKNASVGLGTKETHPPASDFENIVVFLPKSINLVSRQI